MTSTTVPMPACMRIDNHWWERSALTRGIATCFVDTPNPGVSPTFDAWRRAVLTATLDESWLEHYLENVHAAGSEVEWIVDLVPLMRDEQRLVTFEAILARHRAVVRRVRPHWPKVNVLWTSKKSPKTAAHPQDIALLRAESPSASWTALYTRYDVPESFWTMESEINYHPLAAYARSHGYTDVLRFMEVNASTSTLVRPELALLRHLIARNVIQRVIVTDIDQLSTQTDDLALLQNEWEQAGVELLIASVLEPSRRGPWGSAQVKPLRGWDIHALRMANTSSATVRPARSVTASERVALFARTEAVFDSQALADLRHLVTRGRTAAEEAGWVVALTLEERREANDLDRPMLTVLRDAAQPGLVTRVVVTGSSRLAIAPGDLSVLKEELAAVGCRIAVVGDLEVTV
jgi:DNA invertase Pin-like site-specific DNA recombinase